MRVKVAELTQAPPPKILVVGPRCAAIRIGRDLRELGFDVILEREFARDSGLRFPDILDSDAIPKLRAALAAFRESRSSKVSSSHFCVHPTISPWGDRPELATIAQEMSMDVVGPPARVVSFFASRLTFLAEAERLGIETLVLSVEPMHSLREVERWLAARAQKRGGSQDPVVLRSAVGRGEGVGIRVIHEHGDLARELPLWLDQLRRNTGEAILFAERYLEGARHITVPFTRFANGDFKVFPMVDSSLQSRHRKLIEFCASGSIEPEAVEKIERVCRILADHSKFTGVGACEFLVDGPRAYLKEGIPRLTASFALWEKVAGTRAVDWQIASVLPAYRRGNGLSAAAPVPRKAWAVGVGLRIYAEDPVLELPQPGVVHALSSQTRWETAFSEAELDLEYQEGDEVPHDSSGMLGLLTVGARGRQQCLDFARDVLKEIWITGSLQTNERFLAELIGHPWIQEGVFHAGFVEEEFVPKIHPSPEIQSVFVGLTGFLLDEGPDSSETPLDWFVQEQRIAPDRSLLRWVSDPDRWEYKGKLGVSGLVNVEATQMQVCVFPISPGRWIARVGAWFRLIRAVPRTSMAREPKEAHPIQLYSQLTGRVHALLFREGAHARSQEPLLVIESLHCLIPHRVPTDVIVRQWKVKAEDIVQYGQVLAELIRAKEDGCQNTTVL